MYLTCLASHAEGRLTKQTSSNPSADFSLTLTLETFKYLISFLTVMQVKYNSAIQNVFSLSLFQGRAFRNHRPALFCLSGTVASQNFIYMPNFIHQTLFVKL